MRIKSIVPMAMFAISKREWECMLLPTIAIKRKDTMPDERTYIVLLGWLLFQMFIRIKVEK